MHLLRLPNGIVPYRIPILLPRYFFTLCLATVVADGDEAVLRHRWKNELRVLSAIFSGMHDTAKLWGEGDHGESLAEFARKQSWSLRKTQRPRGLHEPKRGRAFQKAVSVEEA